MLETRTAPLPGPRLGVVWLPVSTFASTSKLVGPSLRRHTALVVALPDQEWQYHLLRWTVVRHWNLPVLRFSFGVSAHQLLLPELLFRSVCQNVFFFGAAVPRR